MKPTDTRQVPGNGREQGSRLPPENPCVGTPPVDSSLPRVLREPVKFYFEETAPPAETYPDFGRCLNAAGDLYRDAAQGEGLIVVPHSSHAMPKPVRAAAALAPVIADRVLVTNLRVSSPPLTRPAPALQ
ncbi:MAG: hypothetical protein HYS13_11660 [Planctomycetia bacterium]|nr:hypothetical protein [Planctomycetia bacterium]